jgi:hypothetical protein
MTSWDLPYLGLFALPLWARVSDGRGLGALERALGFFGVGGVAAGPALAEVLAVSGAAGLAFAALAERQFGGHGADTLVLGLMTAAGAGLAWIRVRTALRR